jgi:hypothetical protein
MANEISLQGKTAPLHKTRCTSPRSQGTTPWSAPSVPRDSGVCISDGSDDPAVEDGEQEQPSTEFQPPVLLMRWTGITTQAQNKER